eukprot:CAMPEP_0117047288 /NCGR_PEP_ID=MMETSP0472-20121206/32681_1 /TAXON_ID=693140 ORGANISM="Tiarina fusus, Strain LIS" /NCGR_SAMPLE_ID=MMETSP0472 /ASSEMBLY_ACC=CAM_ASM_000603 /LENGTH=206 /DNA_ID=CAMNT_0004759933 /DNA_START=113 /DNA_END=734 /DNA_ORIENTATION=-
MKTATSLLLLTSSVAGFSVLPQHSASSSTALYGLFDGVKDAFSAPPSELDAERETPIDIETPIDRWMGWSVAAENAPQKAQATPDGFIDSMDETNYLSVELPKPMGIIFEENDADMGGIFIQSLKDDGVAAESGVLKPGDQLVAVGTNQVTGFDFDDALGAILDSTDEKTKLTIFRGTAKQLYGPTGPSKEWLSTFCSKGGVEASA